MLKKFWKRRGRGRDISLCTTSTSADDSEFHNTTTLPGVDTDCSPEVFQYLSSDKEGADDNVASSHDTNTLDCTATTTSNKDDKPPDKDVSNYKSKAVKAYNWVSGAIFAVASSMDWLLTACSDRVCVQANEDETTYASLSENYGTKSSSFA
jgi:hypothetical protein